MNSHSSQPPTTERVVPEWVKRALDAYDSECIYNRNVERHELIKQTNTLQRALDFAGIAATASEPSIVLEGIKFTGRALGHIDEGDTPYYFLIAHLRCVHDWAEEENREYFGDASRCKEEIKVEVHSLGTLGKILAGEWGPVYCLLHKPWEPAEPDTTPEARLLAALRDLIAGELPQREEV